MLKRYSSFVAMMLLVAAAFALTSSPTGSLRAQNRHAYLEEFTGSWCGFCVRGSYAIETLKLKYPNGQVGVLSIHNGDPMSNAQGDSLTQCIGGPSGQRVPGFPDSWAARQIIDPATSWNVDPSQWGTGVAAQFGLNYPDGIVDNINAQAADVTCKVDQVSFDLKTNMITARVTATFKSAMSGDFRLNLMVTEDSVSGPAGTTWDQHNYYSSTNSSIGANLPDNPYYNEPGSISGWQYMDVFREAVGGIWGQKGVIPANTSGGASYSYTFTFPMPSVIVNPNHVHLVGIVHQFSSTDETMNEVFDEMEVPLLSTPIPVAANQIDVTGQDGQYIYAHASGDTTTVLSLQNNGNSTVDVNLALDPTAPMPAGWSVTFTPSKVTIPAGQNASVNAKFTAPEQSNYAVATIMIMPSETGVYIPLSKFGIGALSDNTLYGIFYPTQTGIDAAAINGLPDSMRLHSAAIPLSFESVGTYDPATFSIAMFVNDPQLDNTGGSVWTPVMQNIDDLLAQGKRVFISTTDAGSWAFAGSTSTKTQAVQAFFKDTLGLKYTTNKSRINSSNQYVQFSISGTTDPIAAAPLPATLYANASGSLQGSGESAIFSVGTKATSLFYTDGAKANNVSFKYQSTSGARLVYLGFTLNNLSSQKWADTIFRRSVEWLLGNSTPSVISANPSSLDFGTVLIGNNKTLPVTIKNSSASQVVISDLSVSPATVGFTATGFTLPITLAANGTATINVVFTPTTQGSKSAAITLQSGESTTTIPLTGVASSSGVSDDGTTVLGISASPNPFHGLTTVQYVAANGEQNVSFAAYDLLGREIAQLPVKNTGGNTYTASFDGSKLAEGTYVIVAHSSKGSHEVRVVNQ